MTRNRARLASLATAAALLCAPALAQDVSYEVAGESFTGHFAAAEAPKGLVIILHDWDGMTDYERKRAAMLADLGYDAFAIDLFGDDTPADTVEHRRAATGALYRDRERMRALISAGVAQARALSSAEKAVTMGYCFGGAAALELARAMPETDMEGVVTFHGGLSTPQGASWPAETPPLLILHGGADTSVTMDDVKSLNAELEFIEADYRIEIYAGAPHAWTVFGSSRYREAADRESWSAFTAFLSERLGG